MTALAMVDREMRPIETYRVTRTGVSVRSVFWCAVHQRLPHWRLHWTQVGLVNWATGHVVWAWAAIAAVVGCREERGLGLPSSRDQRTTVFSTVKIGKKELP